MLTMVSASPPDTGLNVYLIAKSGSNGQRENR